MRIIHTIPGMGWGGLEHRTLETARWQNERGHAALVLASPGGISFQRAQELGLPVEPVDFRSPLGFRLVGSLRESIRRHRAQIIDTHCNRDSAVAAFCADLGAVVRTRHTKNRQFKRSRMRRLRWRLSYDYVIACANCIGRELIGEGAAPREGISVIGEWAEPPFFARPDTPNAVDSERRVLGLAPGLPVLGGIGAMRPDNGFEDLIRAVAALRGRGFAVQCLIVGGAATALGAGNAYVDTLRALAATEQVSDIVRFAGYTNDVASMMRLIDVAVVTTRHTAQTRVIPQAFATGRTVVAYDAGAINELVHDGKTGLLVAAGDVRSLQSRLHEILTNDALFDRLTREARRYAESELRMDAKMESTLAAYARAIARAHIRPLAPLRSVAARPGEGDFQYAP